MTVRDDIIGAMWAKWVFIVSIAAVTSLMRAPVGDIVAVQTPHRPPGLRSPRRWLGTSGGPATEVEVLGDFAERARAAGVPAPLIGASVLALRVHNQRVLTASAS